MSRRTRRPRLRAARVLTAFILVSVTVCVLAGLTLASSAVSAPAAESPDAPAARISDLTGTADGVRLELTGTNLPEQQGLLPETVEVTFRTPSGETVELPAQAQVADSRTQVDRRTAVLAVDTSGSLGEAGMQAVKEAAGAFLDRVPAEVEVGLVTFGRPAEVRVQPTTDHQAVRQVVDGLEDDGDTALYDAVVEAVGMLPAEGSGRVLVLTDGEDEGTEPGSPGSVASLEQAVQAVQASGAELTAVAYGDDTSLEALRQLAAAGAGQLVSTGEAAGLADAFEEVARQIATTLVVDVAVPPQLRGTSGNLTVNVRADELRLGTTSFRTLGAASAPPTGTATPSAEPSLPPPAAAAPPAAAGRLALYAGTVGLFVSAVTIVVLLVSLRSRRESPEELRRRNLALYTMGPSPTAAAGGASGTPSATPMTGTTTKLGNNPVVRSAVGLADRVVARGPRARRLSRDLEAADIPLRPAEWVVVQVAVPLVVGVLLLLLSAGNPLALVLGLLLGLVGPPLLLSVRRSRRERAFLAVLPDTLGLLASGLRAGYSLPQAMGSVVREGQEPMRSEFNRALVEVRLGVQAEDALESIGTRMDNQDFRWVVMAIRIQREVGGNLAELLDTVAATLRERARLRRQVDTLSAEGRLSAWIVGVLPVVFCLYLAVARPDYLRPLYTETLGIFLAVSGLLIFCIGVLGLRWAVKVDV